MHVVHHLRTLRAALTAAVARAALIDWEASLFLLDLRVYQRSNPPACSRNVRRAYAPLGAAAAQPSVCAHADRFMDK